MDILLFLGAVLIIVGIFHILYESRNNLPMYFNGYNDACKGLKKKALIEYKDGAREWVVLPNEVIQDYKILELKDIKDDTSK